MANSLQDQLLKAGVANKKQAVRAKKAKNTKEKQQRKGVEVVDEVAELARAAEQDKVARDRELNQLKTEAAERKAIQAQIRQLISLNRDTERGETDFSFTDESVVKTLMLSEQQRQALVRGALTIVKMNGIYDLVPRKVAEKIAERDGSVLILCNEKTLDENLDDEYSDFKVPDDLMW